MSETDSAPSTPSLLQEIEAADTLDEAMTAVARLSLRAFTFPIRVGREILNIVKDSDPGEMSRGIRQF